MITDWIEVGEVSAERDQNLQHYFYDNGVSKKLVANKKQYLLLGRKGAGKTAVFSHLASSPTSIFAATDVIVPLSLQSYNWQAHNLLSDNQKAGGFQHRDSWRFVLYVEAVRALNEKLRARGAIVPKKIEKAAKVLEKIFSTPVPSWTDLLGQKLFNLAKFELPKAGLDDDGMSFGGGEISFEQLRDNVELKHKLNKNIEGLTAFLESSLSETPESIRVFFLFDRLDEAWVSNFIDESKSIVSGLLHASEHVLHQFDGRLRPIVFLREDIFSTFDINDRNKLKHDCSESLLWDQESIERLILERVNFYATKKSVAPLSELQQIFIEKEMRSRATPVKHIFNRTMCRPRDMVAFLDKTFKAAKADELHSPDGMQISTQAIYDAESSYGDYLFEELSDEWRNQNQDFLEYLRTFENLRYAAITPDELKDALIKKGLVNDHAEFRSIMRFLFENSIIGITVGKSKQWRYKCFFPSQAFSDADVVKIHPGLIKRLGLTESSSERASAVADKLILDREPGEIGDPSASA
ncbi:P-loop ATPase, Sll1717 family [Burkholderia stagnalis]|uniref:P-loop ATPase, Sll1717 family n=1 Tax=Burkholderia stagnalis TaxID=1503054 RepID=UPI000F5D67C3|nr:ATPase [Burkholderia stagnalis]